jgi:signal transduction histidine kinase
MRTPDAAAASSRPLQFAPVRLFEVAVVVPTVLLLAWQFAATGAAELSESSVFLGALFWTVTIGLVELLPVPTWKSLQVGAGFPLYTAVAFTYPPVVAGLVALLGSSDPREIKRQVHPLRAVFNRTQLALSLFFASSVFHLLGGETTAWSLRLAIAAPVSVIVFNLFNTGFASIAIALEYRIPLPSVLRHMRIGSPIEFLISYLGLGILGVILARLYADVGWWAVAAFAMPLLLARQMFFRTRALEDATKELQDREAVLRALSNRMAEERQDERKQIAGYLHDDLAQVLYRMALHLDISDKQLAKGDSEQAREEIAALRSSRDRAMQLVRALIKDLNLSPLGRAGLGEALKTFAREVEKDTGVAIRTRLAEIEMAPPVQLLCYHVAREAVMNAIKHAGPSTITISLEPTADGARLRVADDGAGFDVDLGSPEGHYGLKMMKERAQVAGGDFHIDSAPGRGTTITADFPTSWMVEADGDGQQRSEVAAPGSPT